MKTEKQKMFKNQKRKIILTIIGTILLIGMMGTAAAGALVIGTIYRADSTTVVADATVNAYSDAAHTELVATQSVTTNTFGRYNINVDLDGGDPVYITAEKDGSSGSSSGTILNYGTEDTQVNIAIVDVSIPEFATIAIPASIALIGGLLFMRRKEE